MSKVLVNESSLTGIADAIRGKNGETTTYKPSEMAAAITAIPVGGGGGEGIPEEALVLTGNCEYMFAYGGWDWFLEAYGDRITTKDITNTQYMFRSSKVESIPFDINTTGTGITFAKVFYDCHQLKNIGKVTFKLNNSTDIFMNCYMLRETPKMVIDWSYALSNTTNQLTNVFNGCYSMRKLPTEFMDGLDKIQIYQDYSIYTGFNKLYSLDEAENLPLFINTRVTSSRFFGSSTGFRGISRVKNITFSCNEDGTPKVREWKSQTLDLVSGYAGYAATSTEKNGILNYNSGITADKEVTDDTSYQALKNDPDWFTCKVEYSRYNHDSAVATINSLPDTSAYLASAGGTNTIKFKGASGSLTDGGAINTLSADEIAQAAAKGWTVTLS